MNAPERFFLADVQATADARAVAIDRVGVKSIKFPPRVRGAGGVSQSTVATIDMYVALPHQVKGTHMSRFLDVLHAERRALNADPRIAAFTVESENFESIHKRFAYALIRHDKRA